MVTPVHSTVQPTAVVYPMARGQHPSSYDRIRNATSNAETVVQTLLTKKHHSSILLEAVSPKYKCTASVWIVCNTMSLSHPESLDRSSHGYLQILFDTDESPALTSHLYRSCNICRQMRNLRRVLLYIDTCSLCAQSSMLFQVRIWRLC